MVLPGYKAHEESPWYKLITRTVGDLDDWVEQLYNEAYAEGYDKGHADGYGEGTLDA